MRLPAFAAIFALGLAALPVHASEEVEHYDAKPSTNLAEALETLAAYNAKVAEVMARDGLDVQDMEEVHEYTYTMEQAVARIASDLESVAALLEEVHQSCEGDDTDALRSATGAYLDLSAPLTD